MFKKKLIVWLNESLRSETGVNSYSIGYGDALYDVLQIIEIMEKMKQNKPN